MGIWSNILMKFIVRHTSDCFDDEEKEVQLDTLAEFMNFVKKSGYSVIVHDYSSEHTPFLEIYDGWRE
jgi:uncharacterized protein YheU (UPF0270 family)